MKNSTKLAGAAVACAALCAVAVVPVLLAGGGIAALSGGVFGVEVAVLVMGGTAVALAAVMWRRHVLRRSAATSGGCGGTCGNAQDAAPSCTLPAK